MNSGLVSWVLAAAAIASVFASRSVIAEAWQPGGRAQAAAAQVIVTGGMLVSSTLVSGRLIQFITVGAFLMIIFVNDLQHPRPGPLNGAPFLPVIALWVWLYVVNLFSVEDGEVTRLISGVTLVVFLIVQRRRPINVQHFLSAALLTIAAILVWMPFYAKAFTACGRFKCTDFGAILQGPFGSGNLLGLAAAMCIALLLASPGRHMIAVAFLLGVLYATMSRTSLITIGVVAILVIFDRVLRLSGKGLRTAAAWLALAIAAAPMLISVWLINIGDPAAFSNRGRIWSLGWDAVAGREFVGRGLDWWDDLSERGYFGSGFNSFPHSEYLLLYFSGGWVALMLLGIILYQVVFRAIIEHGSLAHGAVVPLMFATSGLIETIWNPLTVDTGTWLFLAMIASVAPRAVSGWKGDGADDIAESVAASPSTNQSSASRRHPTSPLNGNDAGHLTPGRSPSGAHRLGSRRFQ